MPEHKILCICIKVYRNYEGKNFHKIYEISSALKNKKLKKIVLIEKYKDMSERLLIRNSKMYIQNWTWLD